LGRAPPGRGRQCGQWSIVNGRRRPNADPFGVEGMGPLGGRVGLAFGEPLRRWGRGVPFSRRDTVPWAAGLGLPSASPYGVEVGESRSADRTQPPGRPGRACLRRAPTALESGNLLRSMGPGPPWVGSGRRTAPGTAAPNPPPALRLVPRPCKGRIKTRELGPSFSGTAICCVY